jgi:peptidyl-tRNA hydrolase
VDDTYRLYALIRNDLGMDAGKIASQAGHAYLGAFLQCKDSNAINAYHSEFPASPGTKIALRVPDLDQLLMAEQQAKEVGLSFFRVVDSGCKNFFNGEPTVTALGIGPATKAQIQHITKRFKLL